MSEQSPAEKAYAAATAAIEQALIDGATRLDLTGAEYSALEQIPDSIADIKGLRVLKIPDTQVGSLGPIANIKSLAYLDADKTKITDIGPLTHLTKLTVLDLSDTPVADFAPIARLQNLTHLYAAQTSIDSLAPIARLAKLEHLNLFGTNITDIAALQGLRGMLDENDPQADYLSALAGTPKLKWLSLSYTNITDLRPILSCPDLEHPANSFDGVDFKGTTATRNDPRLREISEIENNTERSKQLFAYLRSMPPLDPPVPVPSDRAPDYIVPDNGPARSIDITPDAADPDQQELQTDLVIKSNELTTAIGHNNELAGLKSSVDHYRKRVSVPILDIRLKLLYSAANTLRTAYEAHEAAVQQGRINDELPPQIAAPLKDLVETHALFFTGFPNAANVHAQMLSGLTGQRDPATVQSAETLVRSLNEHPEVLEPEDAEALTDDLAAARGTGPSAEIGEQSLTARLWNLLGAIGRKIYKAGKWGGAGGTGIIASHDIPAWLLDNQTIIQTWLKAAQGPAAIWFERVLDILRGLGLH